MFHVRELLHLVAHDPVDDGQVVARVGERHFPVRAVGVDGALHVGFRALHYFICAANRG